jgi:CIC family chloride channel protein
VLGLPALPVYVVLGVLAGLVSVGFQRNVLLLRELFQRSTMLPGWSKPAAGGLATGVCALVGLSSVQAGGVAGLGLTQLAEALQRSLPVATLLVLGVLKFVATLFSFASGGCGGVFAPALFMGAMLGGALDGVGHHLLGLAPVPSLTLVGMGACFAGMLRAPVAGVLILYELTGTHELLAPLAVANVCAYLVARHCERLSLYEALLARDGLTSSQRPSADPHWHAHC